MEILRTPEEYFNNLEDYNFSENYIKIKIADNQKLRTLYKNEVVVVVEQEEEEEE